jgi:hypothetical protein
LVSRQGEADGRPRSPSAAQLPWLGSLNLELSTEFENFEHAAPVLLPHMSFSTLLVKLEVLDNSAAALNAVAGLGAMVL